MSIKIKTKHQIILFINFVCFSAENISVVLVILKCSVNFVKPQIDCGFLILSFLKLRVFWHHFSAIEKRKFIFLLCCWDFETLAGDCVSHSSRAGEGKRSCNLGNDWNHVRHSIVPHKKKAKTVKQKKNKRRPLYCGLCLSTHMRKFFVFLLVNCVEFNRVWREKNLCKTTIKTDINRKAK